MTKTVSYFAYLQETEQWRTIRNFTDKTSRFVSARIFTYTNLGMDPLAPLKNKTQFYITLHITLYYITLHYTLHYITFFLLGM